MEDWHSSVKPTYLSLEVVQTYRALCKEFPLQCAAELQTGTGNNSCSLSVETEMVEDI